MADTTPNTCPTCGGDGMDGDHLCRTCMGRSTIPIRTTKYQALKEQFDAMDSIQAVLTAIKAKTDNLPEDTESVLDDILDKCNDILDKCNDILEQLQE